MQTFSIKFGKYDAASDGNWGCTGIWLRTDRIIDASSTVASSDTNSYVSYGGPFPDPDQPKKKYDPFGAVELWAKPKRQKRPSSFVAFNQVPNERPRKGRRGKH